MSFIKSFLGFLLIFTSVLIASSSSTPPKASPFSFLKGVEGAKKGDKVHGIGDVKHYLQRFGYLEHHRHQQNHSDNDHHHHRQHHRHHIHSHQDHGHHHNNHFDDALESAIRTYQANYKLEPTGFLDRKTISKMMQPRCAMADIIRSNNINRTRMLADMKWAQAHESGPLYSFFSGAPRWPPSKFTLSFGFPNSMSSLAQKAIRRAFSIWSYNTHFRFFEAPFEVADIKVSFHRGYHGDGFPFDGRGGILGHSFQPTTGVLHLDADENWVVGEAPYSFDLVSVALHEIGHILGLMHSSDTDAIMYPILPMGRIKGLNWDDVQGIRALYNDLL